VVRFSIFNRSDNGLTDKSKLVTCKFVNFVVHDGGLEYIYLTEAQKGCFT
jgi:hypothetical protein